MLRGKPAGPRTRSSNGDARAAIKWFRQMAALNGYHQAPSRANAAVANGVSWAAAGGTVRWPLCCVCSNALTSLIIHAGQVDKVVLSVCITLCRCKAPKSHSLGIVLRNTPTFIATTSYCKLAKAAARCSAFPSKSEPFRHVFCNT